MTALSTDSPLSGRRILLTRPLEQQESLRAALEQGGGEGISLPLLAIEAIEDDQARQKARALIQDLDQFHCIIFISTNAVKYGGNLIEDFWPQFPLGVQVIAIGESTARAAQQRFACPVIHPEQGSDSEAVLALSALAGLTDKRVAIVRGEGGRELLATRLVERGARVDYIETYRRVPTGAGPAEFRRCVLDQHCDAITVHSGESLLRLLAVSADNMDKVTLIPLAVPSQRVARQAREAGFTVVLNADGADDASMLGILTEWFARSTNVQDTTAKPSGAIKPNDR